MDDISRLIQEAKPMYFARKKRNNRIKSVMAMLVLVAGVGFLYPQNSTITYDDWLFGEMQIADSTSVIEDMGFAVDEYGFLKV